MRGILFCVILSIITGCAGIDVSPYSANDTRPVRDFSAEFNSGEQVIVGRDLAFSASACEAEVKIDDTLVAWLRPGERIVFRLEPAESYYLSISGKGHCPGHARTDFDMVEGKPKYFMVQFHESARLVECEHGDQPFPCGQGEESWEKARGR